METRSIGLHTYFAGKSNFFDLLTINYLCFLINCPSLVDVFFIILSFYFFFSLFVVYNFH